MQLEPLSDKWTSFGWEVMECNGNDISALIKTFQKAKANTGKPKVIIANTKMGYGVPGIENDYRWHGKAPNDEEIIIKAAKETQAIISMEEHQITGGLGSAVAEVVVKNHPAKMKMFGINDQFGESGEPEELMMKYGLKAELMAVEIMKFTR